MIVTGTIAYAAASGWLPGHADVVVDHVADELRVRDERRRDVVAERQAEREDRAGDDRRQRQRQDRPAGTSIPARPPRSADASSSEFGIRSRPA